MSFLPKSPDGWTAWDYANAILDRLSTIADAVTDSGQEVEKATRFLSVSGEPFSGATPVSRAVIQVPPGARWDALGFSVNTGSLVSNNNGSVAVYRNVESASTFLGRWFISSETAIGAYMPLTALPDNVILEENTRLIFRVSMAQQDDGLMPSVNIVTREVVFGPRPIMSRETDSN